MRPAPLRGPVSAANVSYKHGAEVQPLCIRTAQCPFALPLRHDRGGTGAQVTVTAPRAARDRTPSRA